MRDSIDTRFTRDGFNFLSKRWIESTGHIFTLYMKRGNDGPFTRELDELLNAQELWFDFGDNLKEMTDRLIAEARKE
jgi:hypothetical protein